VTTQSAHRWDWRFSDFIFESTNDGRDASMDWCAAWYFNDGGYGLNDTLFLRITSIEGENGIASLRPTGLPTGDAVDEAFIVDSTLHGAEYSVYFATRRGAILGTIAGGTNPTNHHIYRIGAGGRWADMILAHSRAQCCSTFGASVRGDSHTAEAVAQFFVVRANDFRMLDDHVADGTDYDDPDCTGVGTCVVDPGECPGGTNSCCDGVDTGYCDWSPFGIFPQNGSSDERLMDVIVENNQFATWLRGLGARTVTVRNNLFQSQAAYDFARIDIGSDHTCANPSDWGDDIMIYNNSAYTTTSTEHMIQISNQGQCSAQIADRHELRNNVLWNTSASAEAWYCDDGAESWCNTIEQSNNIDRDDTASTPFAVAAPDVYDPTDWYLTGAGATYCVDAGLDLGSRVYADFEHRQRIGAYDIGAIEGTGASTATHTGLTCTGASFQ
jgi:hypothetical protein